MEVRVGYIGPGHCSLCNQGHSLIVYLGQTPAGIPTGICQACALDAHGQLEIENTNLRIRKRR